VAIAILLLDFCPSNDSQAPPRHRDKAGAVASFRTWRGSRPSLARDPAISGGQIQIGPPEPERILDYHNRTVATVLPSCFFCARASRIAHIHSLGLRPQSIRYRRNFPDNRELRLSYPCDSRRGSGRAYGNPALRTCPSRALQLPRITDISRRSRADAILSGPRPGYICEPATG
jgi:hypothetical protein